jgi:hypothetical protein
MKTFKEFLIEQVELEKSVETIQVDGYLLIIFFENSLELLTEAIRKGRELIKNYTYNIHQRHADPNLKHMHVYERGKKIFAINIDGTAHDKSHKIRIPNKVADAIRKKHPEFQIPKDNFIENLKTSLEEKNLILLLEKSGLLYE